MGVIRSADHHRIDLLVHFRKHPAEILIPLGPGILLQHLGRARLVNITDRHDVLSGNPPGIAHSLAPHPDAGHIQFFVRLVTEGHLAAADQETSPRRPLEKPPPVQRCLLTHNPLFP